MNMYVFSVFCHWSSPRVWSGWRGQIKKLRAYISFADMHSVHSSPYCHCNHSTVLPLNVFFVCLFPYQHTDSIGNAEYTLVGIHICIHLGCFDSHAGIYDFHRIRPHLCIWERRRTWNNYINIYVVKYVSHFEDQPNTSIYDIRILFKAVEAVCLESLMLNSRRVLPINQ